MAYLPKIEAIANEMIKILIEDNFFEDFGIKDHTFAKKRFCDELTKKFISGELDFDSDQIFYDDELDVILKEIGAESVLRDLQKNGFVSSYEDENTEETFFLTEKGKEELNTLREIDDFNALKIFLSDND